LWCLAINAFEPKNIREYLVQIILFNKPFNVLCQFTDPGKRLNLGDCIAIPGIYAAGRLDYRDEGLLVLTDTAILQKRITAPTVPLDKTYWAQVEGFPTEDALHLLASGVLLEGVLTPPAVVCRLTSPPVWPAHTSMRERLRVPTNWLSITLAEGRAPLVRRMTAAVGFPALRLIRRAVGAWDLENLAPGEWRAAIIPSEWLENRQEQ
jgi:23S rRNA pseudouridine2457 synthase